MNHSYQKEMTQNLFFINKFFKTLKVDNKEKFFNITFDFHKDYHDLIKITQTHREKTLRSKLATENSNTHVKRKI